MKSSGSSPKSPPRGRRPGSSRRAPRPLRGTPGRREAGDAPDLVVATRVFARPKAIRPAGPVMRIFSSLSTPGLLRPLIHSTSDAGYPRACQRRHRYRRGDPRLAGRPAPVSGDGTGRGGPLRGPVRRRPDVRSRLRRSAPRAGADRRRDDRRGQGPSLACMPPSSRAGIPGRPSTSSWNVSETAARWPPDEVSVLQGGDTLLVGFASFHDNGAGADVTSVAPGAPRPEDMPAAPGVGRKAARPSWGRRAPLDRSTSAARAAPERAAHLPRRPVVVRARARTGCDPRARWAGTSWSTRRCSPMPATSSSWTWSFAPTRTSRCRPGERVQRRPCHLVPPAARFDDWHLHTQESAGHRR